MCVADCVFHADLVLYTDQLFSDYSSDCRQVCFYSDADCADTVLLVLTVLKKVSCVEYVFCADQSFSADF